jgi:hypothetical protein
VVGCQPVSYHQRSDCLCYRVIFTDGISLAEPHLAILFGEYRANLDVSSGAPLRELLPATEISNWGGKSQFREQYHEQR